MRYYNILLCNERRAGRGAQLDLLISLLLAALLFGLTAMPARAHEVEIQDADPAPGAVLDESPQVVTVVFTEELIDGESSFQVLDRDGNAVDDGDAGLDFNDPEHATLVAHISRPLDDGIYTVSYQVKVLDGDVTEGSFRFAIGDKYASQVLATPVSEQRADPASEPAPSLSEDAQQASSPILFIVLITVALIIVALIIVFIAKRRSTPSDSDSA